MSCLLALDTSSDRSSVALWYQGRIWQESRTAPRQHAQLILPQIHALLAEAGVSLTQLDELAFGRGPGSFTGLRIAAATVQGLAMALDVPVVPVSTLAAQAWQIHQKTGAQQVLSCLDARMDEVYWAVYHFQANAQPYFTQAETLSKPEALDWPKAPAETGWAVGSGLTQLARFPAATRTWIQHTAPDIVPQAAAILQLAMQGEAVQPRYAAHEIEPTYLRNQVTHSSTPLSSDTH